MSWVNGSALVFGSPKAHAKNRRLALIKRRHLVWLRRQLVDTQLADDDTGGLSDEN
jgi:hypothetical protein